MPERMINPVADNTDKQNTYRKDMAKHKKAMEYGFYFEALLIDYAMMEDRLKSFLYYMGALKNRNTYKQVDAQKAKDALKQIVEEYKDKKESGNLGISSISGKRKIIRCALQWAATTEETPKKGTYQAILKDQLERKIDISAMLDDLAKMEKWCAYRNEVIHCLLNKNADSVDAELARRAAEGLELARRMDGYVGKLKSANVIRKRMNMSSD